MALTLTWPITSDGAGAVTYTAEDWRTLLTNIYTEGILGSGSFKVSERALGASMALDITAGVAVIEGDDAGGQGRYLVEGTESLSGATITTADGSNPRIDLVGIQLRDPSAGGASGRDSIFSVVAGTAAASPSPPATPDSFLPLAEVSVSAGATSIVDANITDLRTRVRLAHDTVAHSPGDIRSSIRSTAESGWLKLDGSTVSGANTAHPDLWAVAPAAWKSGTDLVLPNMSDRVLQGGGTLGDTDGSNTATLSTANMPSHVHSMSAHVHNLNNHTHGSGSLATDNDTHDHEVAGGSGYEYTEGGGPRETVDTRATAFFSLSTNDDTHSHDVTGSTAGPSNNSTSSAGSGNTGSAGSGDAIAIEQAALRVNYFVKT